MITNDMTNTNDLYNITSDITKTNDLHDIASTNDNMITNNDSTNDG